MKKISIGILLLLVSACSVAKQEPTTENIEDSQSTKTRAGERIINIIDRTDYYLTVDKPYFVILPVREYNGKYYYIDRKGYIILSYDLSIMAAKQGHSAAIESQVPYSFIPKSSVKKIVFPATTTHFVMYVMDSWWTSVMITRIGIVHPLSRIPHAKTMKDYVQKIEYEKQNFIISGNYWNEVVVLKYDSFLTTDR